MITTLFIAALVFSVLALFASMAIVPIIVESEIREAQRKPDNLVVFEQYMRLRDSSDDANTPDAA